MQQCHKNALGGHVLMICTHEFSIKIYNGIHIWNQQELLYKMVYKLFDLVKVGRKPPLNGHGPFIGELKSHN